MMTRTTRARSGPLAALLAAIGLIAAGAWAAPASAEGEGPDFCKEFAWGCFSAGTYGRVHPSWNLRGGKGRPANLVSHGTRLELSPYAEVDLYYRKTFDDLPKDEEHPIQVGAVMRRETVSWSLRGIVSPAIASPTLKSMKGPVVI